MPDGPTPILGFFVNHLVVLSLAGFLLAGLLVFDVIEPPRMASAAGRSTPASPAGITETPALTRESAHRQVESPHGRSADWMPGTPAADADAGGRGRPATEGTRKAPRLIGGSLPIYADPRPGPRPALDRADNGFRPPSDAAGGSEPGVTRAGLVQQARRAFWNGDFEAAEAAYMTLLAAYPGDADAFGELGNLYQSMGKPTQALDAYYEAGIRLKAQGERSKLQQVIDLFAREGDARVDRLRP